MIRYDLTCDKGHAFDGWFAGSDAFDTQARRGFVTCAICGSSRVSRAIMAPSVKRTDRARTSAPVVESPEPAPAPASAALMGEEAQRMRALLRELHAHVVANTEDVGQRFADEARAIHEGEAEARAIRGQGRPDEIRALLEDGIGVLPLPPLPDAGH